MHRVVIERVFHRNGGPPRLARVNLAFGLETLVGFRVGRAFVARDHRRCSGVDVPAGSLGAALNLVALQGNEGNLALWAGRCLDPRRPHICRSTPAALALVTRPLSVRSPFGRAQSSVAQGARLTVASCFHTLASAIRARLACDTERSV